MVPFKKFFHLAESVGSVNKHLTHLEELILKTGRAGAESAINYINDLVQVLDSESSGSKTSIKIDGSPAVIVGTDPDGRFFIGTKSAFNKEPKINYSLDDIKRNHGHAEGLESKLIKAFAELKNTSISGVYQGDFIFDDEIKQVREIDGETFVTFKPNTIVYAVPTASEQGQEILAAKIGIVFHTEYTAKFDDQQKLRFQVKKYGVDASKIKSDRDVYIQDANIDSVVGNIVLTEREVATVNNILRKAQVFVDRIDFEIPQSILDNLNVYINTEIRQGEFLAEPRVSLERYIDWVNDKIDKKIETLKSDRGRQKALENKQIVNDTIEQYRSSILDIFGFQIVVKAAKDIIMDKYHNILRGINTRHFIEADNGDLMVTNPEGLVVSDVTGNAVKLVDRLEFSKANFNK